MLLEHKLEDLDLQKDKINKQIEKRNAQRKLPCYSCNGKHKICELEAIQTYYYTEPYSCTGGDFVTRSDLHFVCPITGDRNRMLFMTNYDIPREKRSHYVNDPEEQFSRMYKHLFKNVTDEDHHVKSDSFNNEYVSKHMKQFGLSIQDLEK